MAKRTKARATKAAAIPASDEAEPLEQRLAEAERRILLLERRSADLEEENGELRERARLGERVREDLAAANEKLELLGRLTKDINSLNADKIFETAGTKIPYILGARYASVYTLEESTGKLILRKHTHGRPIDPVVELEPGDRLVARVLKEGRIRLFTDLDHEGPDGCPLALPHREHYGTRSCIVAPLRAGERTVGVLNLADRVDGKPFSAEHDLPLVQQIADLLAISLRNWRLFEKVQRQAKTDSLTKLANHQAFYEDLAREVTRADRYGSDLAVIMIDIDRFKVTNDNFGHLAGDFALEEVARVLQTTVRLVDTAARYGGDEFALLLPESDVKGATALAERIRSRVAQLRFAFRGHELAVRLSLGVAMYHRGESASELVKAADEALYKAKRDGGDRIAVRA